MTDRPHLFFKRLPLNSISLDKTGADLGYLIAQQLNIEVGSGAQYSIGTGQLTAGGIELKPSGYDLDTWVEFARVDSGFVPIVIGEDPDTVETEAQIWERVLKAVLAQLQRAAPKRHWNAVIGPLPQQHYQKSWKMMEICSLGSIKLSKAETYMLEGRPGDYWWGMEIYSSEGTWPVVANGSTRLYDPSRLDEVVLRELGLVCALISLALSQPWIPRGKPWELSDRRWEVPETPRGTPEWIKSSGTPPAAPAFLADWLGQAWKVVQQQNMQYLTKAIWAFREGLIMMERHPSFALVALTSVLEAVAYKTYRGQEERCECCNQIKESTHRFRRLLEDHLGPERAAWFISFYSKRSKTVHQARLFGAELTSGLRERGNMFASDFLETSSFESHMSFNFVRIVREILLKEFRIDIEPVDPFAAEQP